MKTIAFWVMLILLFLDGCGPFRATPEEIDSMPTTESLDLAELERAKQDIYRVVASGLCSDAVVHIYPEVEFYPLYGTEVEYAAEQLPGASPETWISYRLANNPNQPITRFSEFQINCQYEFVSRTDVVCAGPETNCIIPHGFSAIGFNNAKTQALVYMSKDCSECGGGSTMYLLEKREGSWVIVNSVVLSVS